MEKEIKTIAGRLIFFDLSTILIIDSDNSEIDLATLLKDFLFENNEKSVIFNYQEDKFSLKVDEASDKKLVWRKYGQTTLEKINSFNIINFSGRASIIFQSLNAQLVEIKLTADSFEICPDLSEEVNELHFSGNGNLCRISDKTAQKECGLNNGSDTCIFLIIASQDFECCKFSSYARIVLARLKENDMNAKRIGSCRCLGIEN